MGCLACHPHTRNNVIRLRFQNWASKRNEWPFRSHSMQQNSYKRMMSVLAFSRKQLLQSMLTGVPQIIRVRGFCRKLLKSLVLVTCVMGCTYQMWSFMTVYWSYPTLVDVIVSNPNDIEIPAFTICEYNGLLASKFCRRYGDLCTPKKLYHDFCNVYFDSCLQSSRDEPPKGVKVPAIPPQELPTNISYLRNVYRNLGVDERVFKSEITDKVGDLKSTLISVFNPEGLPTNCFAYNVVWGNASAAVPRVSIRNEIRMLLRMSGSDYFYRTTPLAIQMLVHSPFMKLNPFADGFSVKACTTYRMYLQKTQNYLLPAPYATNCTDYLQMWRSRGGRGPLTQKMCVDECLLNKSLEAFGCFDPTQVSYPDDEAHFCFNRHVNDTMVEECDQMCQAACFDESIKVQIEEFESPITSNQEDKKQCSTGITLSYGRTQVQKFIYSKKYELVEVFGYVGGFLGMWLGLSLIAVCDFLETCLVILLHLAKTVRRRRKTHLKPIVAKVY